MPVYQYECTPCLVVYEVLHGMNDPPLHIQDDLPGTLLIPIPVQWLGHRTELDQELARYIRRLDLAPLLLPKAE